MTGEGGNQNRGVAYMLTPPAIAGAPWTETILHVFGAAGDGRFSNEGLVSNGKGLLFGTTSAGGLGCGTVFQLQPPPVGVTGSGSYKVIYKFQTAGDGCGPNGALRLVGKKGAMYGVTFGGGLCRPCGTVYALKPNGAGGWTESVLHTFKRKNDGVQPYGRLGIDNKGNLYGTTSGGGLDGGLGSGLVYKLAPPAGGTGPWAETVLHTFSSATDGSRPLSGLLSTPDGTQYGVTTSGGAFIQWSIV